MQAIRIHAFSSSMDNLVIEEVPKPVPAPGEVLVKVLYAPVNPSDFNFIRGDYDSALSRVLWNRDRSPLAFDPAGLNPHPEPPYTIGGEGVGIVEAAGGGALANRLIGKHVAFASGPPRGSWAQYTSIDARKVFAVPDGIDTQQAAMYIFNPLSCYAMVLDVLGVQRGSWLLQSGAGSALGQMVVRLGRQRGFRTINIVRSEANIEKLRALGADVVINTSEQDLREEVFKATGGSGVDYAMDCVGGDLLTQMMQCMGLNGHMVVYGTLSGLSNTFFSRDLMMPCAKVSGFFAGNWLAQKSLWQKLSTVRALKKLHLAGVFRTDIDRVLPLQDVGEAIRLASTQGHQGKVLLACQESEVGP